MKNYTSNVLRKCLLVFGILILASQIEDLHAINKKQEDSNHWEDSIKSVLYPSIKLDTFQIPIHSNAVKSKSFAASKVANNSYVPNSFSIDKSRPVGEIPISSSVTPTGSVAYSVPIEVYPGANGFQPQVSIAYNSQSGNSSLGVGWNISGLSSISRGSKSIYYDGKAQNVALTKDDAFFLNGARLIKLSETTSLIKYESEQGNIKVNAYLSGSIVKYFSVYFPNGQIGTFGYSTNATNKLEYPITYISDLFSNGITYNYDYINNHYRVSSVNYGSESVVFQYTPRTDIIVSFSSGLKIIEDCLLQKVTCKYNGNVLRNYNLEYSLRNNESFLTSIEYAAPDETSFNPLVFYYGENNVATAYTSRNCYLPQGYSFTDPATIKVVKGKFSYGSDDDGLITLKNLNPYWQHLRSSSLFQHSQRRFDNQYAATDVIMAYSGLEEGYGNYTNTLTAEAGFIDVFCANVDGELGEEVIKVNDIVSGSNDQVTFKVYQANCYTGIWLDYTRTFSFPTVLTDADGDKSIQPKYYFPGDYNGDGKTEVMVVSCNNPFGWAEYPTKCYLIDLESNTILYEGQPFAYNVSYVGNEQLNPTTAFNNTDRLMAMDYDGDGKTDMCLINTQGTYIYTINNSGSTYTVAQASAYTGLKRPDLADKLLLPGEFNGDGKLDLLVSPLVNSSSWSVFYSMGNGQFETSQITNSINRYSTYKYFLQDVNTDGLSDIIAFGTSDYTTYLAKNRGFYYESYTSLPNASPVLVPTNINSRNYFHQILALKNGVVTLFSHPRNDTKEKLLTGMVTSLGVVNKNYYKMLNESSSYYQGYGAIYPYENYQGPYIIVEDQEQYLDGSLNEHLAYSYENAIVHKQGLGFLGFTSMYTNDCIRNRYFTKRFDPLNFSVVTEEESPTTLNTYSYSFSVATNKIAKVRLQTLVAEDELNATSATSSFTYDSYGNPLTVTNDYGGGLSETISNTYVNNLNESSYLLGFLSDQTKTKSRDGLSYTERNYIPSYNKGLPLLKYQYINGNQVLEENFAYDTKGNVTQKSNKSFSSSKTLSTKYAYDIAGRLTKETDPLGLFTEYVYNATNGVLNTVKNHKGQETTIGYDNFLRKISTLNPDGTTNSASLAWNDVGNSGLYYNLDCPVGKPWTKTYYDALGRTVAASSPNIDGTEPRSEKSFDSYGRLYRESLPFIGYTPSLWKTYQYDYYDRPSTITAATGDITSYSYGVRSVTTTQNGISKTKTVDTQGNTIQSVDPAGTITYVLRPDGQPSSIVAPGNVTTTFAYDNIGRQTSILDPSAGTQSYSFDIDGNLGSETNANNQVISYSYDSINRLAQKIQPEFTTTYNYNTDGLIASVVSTNSTSKIYTYDDFLRLYKEKETMTNRWLERTYTLSGGYLISTKYASQSATIVTENYYYTLGHLSEVKLNGTTSIWKLNAVNAFGQPTSATTGSFNRTYGYDNVGFPTSRTAGSFQNFSYVFDVAKGNLTSRTDNIRGIQEQFTYDNLDRLSGFSGNTAQYNNLGNLLEKSDVGTLTYGNTNAPYQVTAASTINSSIPMRNRTVTYNSSKRPASITEGEYSATNFIYNANDERMRFTMRINGINTWYRCYMSDCYEVDLKTGGNKEKLYLNGDYYTSSAVYVKEGTASWQLYYICRDHLGSITHITSSTGAVVQELSYDAWGRLRDPSTQVVYTPGNEPELFLGRGYEGHEHLTQFGLINMNARLYDPVVGRFLSPDPYVQSPDFSQNFNRYSYCLNNPLKYSDPSGEIFATLFGAVSDFLVNTFVKVWTQGFNAWGDADNWHSTKMGWEIDKGLFRTDPNKSPLGQAWELISRCTWQANQTTVGYWFATIANTFGQVNNVTHNYGVTAVDWGGDAGAMTLGNYSMGSKGYRADWKDHLFVHEYFSTPQSLDHQYCFLS